jgi:hypothetical protein
LGVTNLDDLGRVEGIADTHAPVLAVFVLAAGLYVAAGIDVDNSQNPFRESGCAAFRIAQPLTMPQGSRKPSGRAILK